MRFVQSFLLNALASFQQNKYSLYLSFLSLFNLLRKNKFYKCGKKFLIKSTQNKNVVGRICSIIIEINIIEIKIKINIFIEISHIYKFRVENY